jgi:hypothetical protein
MTTRQQLLDLAERVEREEPSEALGNSIAHACGWTFLSSRYTDVGDYWLSPDDEGCWDEPPDWLHSLDAAVTLERKDLWVFVNRYPDVVCVDATDSQGAVVAASRAPDEPRARTAAALRALAQEARDE